MHLRVSPRLVPGALVVTALALATGEARASAETERCARSYEAAQALRQQSKPLAARSELLVCSQAACPAFVRRDCAEWLGAVEREIPSIALRVRGPDGCDRADAVVAIDGTATADAASGKSLDLEPGRHLVRATLEGVSREQTVVVSAGERHRTVVLDLASGDAVCGVKVAPVRPASAALGPPPAARSGPPGSPDRPDVGTRRVPTATWVLGGTGAALGAVAIGFGIGAWSQKGTLDDCKGACAQHDVDTMRRTFLVADVAMVASVLALGGAAWFWLARR